MAGTLRIAIDQWAPVTGGKAEALEHAAGSAARAAAAGAGLLILPEMAMTGYAIGAEAVSAAAEPPGGPTEAALAAIARAQGIAILTGLPQRAPGGGVWNAAVLFDAAGRPLARYAKTHLYGAVDRAQFAAGPALSPVVALGGWKVALAICYDIEFPELARALALAGAEAILVPTANMAPFESVARRIVPARAEENTVFLAYANYSGPEAAFDYFGLSCLCGPDGADLARAGSAPEMIFADLDRARLDTARAAATHLRDRRPDLYAPLAADGP